MGCHEIEPVVFFVPENHCFVWPTFELGHRVTLDDIRVPGTQESVSLVTLSHSPRIFLVENLISSRESDMLIEYMSERSSDEDGLDNSLVGDGVLSQKRTSSNGWDSESTVCLFPLLVLTPTRSQLRSKEDPSSYFVSLKLMKLGSREFRLSLTSSSHSDCAVLQIVRYFPSQHYDLHYGLFLLLLSESCL